MRQTRQSLSQHHLEALESDSWFGSLLPSRRALLLGEATMLRLRDGRRLYGCGDPPNGLWCVLEGQVRLFAYPAFGEEMLFRNLGPGNWCGELSTMDGGPRPQDAVALGATVVLHIPHSAIIRLAERDATVWLDVARLGCQHQREQVAFICQRAAQPVPVRLAKALMSAANDTGSDSPVIRQAELASFVGVSRQTLNRHLKRLEDSGIVKTAYGRVRIVDREQLAALSRTNE